MGKRILRGFGENPSKLETFNDYSKKIGKPQISINKQSLEARTESKP